MNTLFTISYLHLVSLAAHHKDQEQCNQCNCNQGVEPPLLVNCRSRSKLVLSAFFSQNHLALHQKLLLVRPNAEELEHVERVLVLNRSRQVDLELLEGHLALQELLLLRIAHFVPVCLTWHVLVVKHAADR
ncbi:hypothetical protein ECANGB1_2635 [Enterospora canceri]|uniref:Secreted protein n=1 Tax=Enterospora canceri TaxID=1081671 RepID=A0A1Y1S922_9MICR|nr:hypothetical protein ECANGB1_2635 [Enterospora canceri]